MHIGGVGISSEKILLNNIKYLILTTNKVNFSILIFSY
jgi:hypothetical protein